MDKTDKQLIEQFLKMKSELVILFLFEQELSEGEIEEYIEKFDW